MQKKLKQQHIYHSAIAICGLAAALGWCNQAKAQVVIDIQQTNTGVTIYANGSLTLPTTSGSKANCGFTVNPPIANGAIQSNINAICVGNTQQQGFVYNITGSTSPIGQGNSIIQADSSSGDFFGIIGLPMGMLSPEIGILYDPNSSTNPTINSYSVFNGKTLADLGIQNLGVLGVYSINGQGTGNTNTITIIATPAPLAVLGLPITYGWSRRLRRRIKEADIAC